MHTKGMVDEKLKRQKLLIVDDEEGIVESLSEVFGKKFRITMCSNGMEAVGAFKKGRHEKGLADQRMLGMTGLKLIEVLKRIEPSTIALLITGYSDFDTVIEAVNRGLLFKYISKPWYNKILVDIVIQGARKYLTDAGGLKEEYPI